MALISMEHVSKIYPNAKRPALQDIDLEISRGEFVFLVGASGSGKTSLLRLLLREEEATSGEIRVGGYDLRRLPNRQVPQYRRSIGMVFQDYKLLNNKTVWENVAFALEVIGTSRSTIKSLVPKVLKTVGLTGKENNYPRELSGGEPPAAAARRRAHRQSGPDHLAGHHGGPRCDLPNRHYHCDGHTQRGDCQLDAQTRGRAQQGQHCP